jgi:Metallo-beta-lactamase superfamily
MRRFALYLLITGLITGVLYRRDASTQVNTVKELAPGVYFHEGDLRGKGHCNNGWVVFDDYVLVVDANFPSGAEEIIPKIKAQTNKPIRFAFDTHHHGDHAYGNQVWVDNGAVPVAHENVLSEMRKYETGLFGGKPGRWEDTAKQRDDLKNTRLKPPSLLYRDQMIFDDGNIGSSCGTSASHTRTATVSHGCRRTGSCLQVMRRSTVLTTTWATATAQHGLKRSQKRGNSGRPSLRRGTAPRAMAA